MDINKKEIIKLEKIFIQLNSNSEYEPTEEELEQEERNIWFDELCLNAHIAKKN